MNSVRMVSMVTQKVVMAILNLVERVNAIITLIRMLLATVTGHLI